MSAELAEVAFERDGQVAVAAVSGEIDMSNAAAVRLQVAQLVTPDDVALVLDLSGLSFIDSAGLHIVFELGALLEERRQRLFLCVPPDGNVARTVEIVGMPGAVAVHADRAAAIEAAEASAGEARPFLPDTEA